MTLDEAMRAISVMDAVFLPLMPQRAHNEREAAALRAENAWLKRRVGQDRPSEKQHQEQRTER